MATRALIIGGTGGLGQELAKLCREQDMVPTITGRARIEDPDEALLRPASYISLDFGRSASIQQAVDEIANLDNEYDRLKYIFLAAGQGLQRELALTMPGQIHDLIDTNLTGPLKLLGEILLWQRALGEPFHLVTVASTSAWKRRSDETVYGATMAARAQMARDFHQELLRDLPGSKSTLVLPGGMKTGFWDGTGVDTSKFMEPAEVAALIMAEVTAQAEPWLELQIERDGEGKPKLEYGPRLPN